MTNVKNDKNKKSYVKCHYGPSLVLEYKGLRLYGASRLEAEETFYQFDLVISLEYCTPKNIFGGKDNKVGGNLFSKDLRYITKGEGSKTEHLRIYWPDMGVPELDKKFWESLVKFLVKKGRDRSRYDRVYNVMVHCQGGHGRTGTALSVLCGMIDDTVRDENIVKFIRDVYCKEVVETEEQIKYVEKILGVKVKSGVSRKTYLGYIDNASIVGSEYWVKKYFDKVEDKGISKGKKNEDWNDVRMCKKEEHLEDVQKWGYCPGCGFMTIEYERRLELEEKYEGGKKDCTDCGHDISNHDLYVVIENIDFDTVCRKCNCNKFVPSIDPNNSGIGRAITQEDLDRKKGKK